MTTLADSPMTTDDDVELLLFRISMAFRQAIELTPDLVAEWLQSLDAIPSAVVEAAWNDWKTEHDWPPSINQFLDACETAARRAATPTSAPRPPDESTSGQVTVARLMTATRSMLKPRGNLKHMHHFGAENCPICGRADEFAAEAKRWLDEAFAASGAAVDDRRSYACSVCSDTGFVADAVTLDGTEFVRPCHECRAQEYEHWSGGHMEPGHVCAGCAVPRKHRPSLDKVSSAPRERIYEGGADRALPRERDDGGPREMF